MPTIDEWIMLAAQAAVEAAGGQLPEGASQGEALALMAAAIVAGGGFVVPAPPVDGTYVLTATDGVITWEAAA